MSDAEILTSVKNGLLITGDFHDEALKLYIAEVKEFLKSAGVSETTLADSASLGIIIRGVADLWNHGSGGTELSQYFMQRAIQLASISETSAGKDIVSELYAGVELVGTTLYFKNIDGEIVDSVELVSVEGVDGYSPVKGVDYFDGKDGEPGKDGYTPVKGIDYFDGRDGANGNDGYTPIKGVDYFDGKDGSPGIQGEKGDTGLIDVTGFYSKTEIDNLLKALKPKDEILMASKFIVGKDGVDILTDIDTKFTHVEIEIKIGDNLTTCIKVKLETAFAIVPLVIKSLTSYQAFTQYIMAIGFYPVGNKMALNIGQAMSITNFNATVTIVDETTITITKVRGIIE